MPLSMLLQERKREIRSSMQIGFHVILVELHTKVDQEFIEQVNNHGVRSRTGEIKTRKVDSLCYQVWYLTDHWEPTPIAQASAFNLSSESNICGIYLTITRLDYGINAMIAQAWLSLSPKLVNPEEAWHQHPKILSLPDLRRHFVREERIPKGTLPKMVKA